MAKLNPKQQRFVEEYLKDLNAAAAYRRAGYQVKSDHQASANAARMMAHDSIQKAIAVAQAERTTRTQVDVDWVVTKLKTEAEFCGEGSSHAARIKATELLGKHIGMFKERVEHSGPGGGPMRVEFIEVVAPTTEPQS